MKTYLLDLIINMIFVFNLNIFLTRNCIYIVSILTAIIVFVDNYDVSKTVCLCKVINIKQGN